MITAVDTVILVDVLRGVTEFATASTLALSRCTADGPLVACDVVWAELATLFKDKATLNQQLREINIEFSALGEASAFRAGELWRQYRNRNSGRVRVIADFLIGAHAEVQCNRLLTRDKGFTRDYFNELIVITPEAGI